MSERSELLIPGPRPPAPGPFLLAGGGTGGHVIPALAVARELRQRGHRVFFVGTERGLEAKLVPAEGFELQKIEIGGLNRVGIRQKLATLVRLPFTTLGCGKLVRGTSAVFSMGGYVAGPPVMAAILRRTPVVVMEPNAVPGFTNRVIGRFVARALISFPETASYFPRGPDGNHRPAGPRGVFSNPAQAARRRAQRPDHRRQPGLADAEPGRAAKLAAVPQGRISGADRASDRAERASSSCATSLRARASKGEVVPFHHRHARGLPGGRPGGMPVGRGRGIGVGGGRQAVDPGAVSLRRGRPSDPQCRSDGARRRGQAGARRGDERREAVRRDRASWPGLRTPWSGWEKRRGSSPVRARRGARRRFWRRWRACG